MSHKCSNQGLRTPAYPFPIGSGRVFGSPLTASVVGAADEMRDDGECLTGCVDVSGPSPCRRFAATERDASTSQFSLEKYCPRGVTGCLAVNSTGGVNRRVRVAVTASLPRYGIVGRLANDPLDPVGEAAPVANRFGGTIRPPEGRVEVGDDLCGAMGSDDATKPSPIRKMRLRVPDPVLQAPTQCGGRRLGQLSDWSRYAPPSSSGAHARARRPSPLQEAPSDEPSGDA
jgi:hypothetical protein